MVIVWQILKELDDNSIDLTVTSPPYDDLRSYDGNEEFDLDTIAKRATKSD